MASSLKQQTLWIKRNRSKTRVWRYQSGNQNP